MFLIQAMVVVVDMEVTMEGEEAMEGAMVRKMMMAVSVGCYALSSGVE